MLKMAFFCTNVMKHWNKEKRKISPFFLGNKDFAIRKKRDDLLGVWDGTQSGIYAISTSFPIF